MIPTANIKAENIRTKKMDASVVLCHRKTFRINSKQPDNLQEQFLPRQLKKCCMSDRKKLGIYKPESNEIVDIPISESTVHAGFPSPADDFLEGSLDLNKLVIKHPEATFFARVEGDSMRDGGIAEGDILVVDKASEAYDGCLAVAFVDGEFTLKRVCFEADRILLVPSNPKYKTIEIKRDNNFSIWGVVGWIIKKM